ncbi:FUSC family protein [Dyella choica]|uniref:FUSC family protein n=1 Tax=Dyella choica TaxID=1927959 RepID=A0A3S0PL87_9GAMM|nr:FUSC family protein [Dyella choica]RUL79796.1 FUSC family protein [Dyella choica]
MPTKAHPLLARLAGEIKGRGLVKALLALLPFGVLSISTADPIWAEVSLLTISTLIARERLALVPLGVLLHGVTVIAGIYLLLFAQAMPMLFIAACMLLAAGFIRITAEGKKFRSLGTWTFVPMLILASELGSTASAEGPFRQALTSLPCLLTALAPSLAVAALEHRRASIDTSSLRWFSRLDDFGPKAPYGETMAAMVTGVGLAAALVEYVPLHYGQWAIWGVASVVTGTVDTARTKLRQRTVGVIAGVPLGIALGQFVVPASRISVVVALLVTFLTLMAFQRYPVAYFFRCLFVALTVFLATRSTVDALERITHVLLGGAIGMASVIVFHLAGRAGLRRHDGLP